MIDNDTETRAALRKAATVIQSLERREAARSEPIAIVGVGCRLPGGVVDLDSLGALLRAGTDAVGPIPRDRFDVEAVYDADPTAPGKIPMREAGFLRDPVDQFDPAFFGLSPREAAWLDPQHRLLLECAWEALDDAGMPAEGLRESRVGVYVGIGPNDYGRRMDTNPRSSLEGYTATGNLQCFSAGRLSYLLGVQGPALALDTACSSSLVSLHLACQAIRDGECELALAGGVLLMLSVEPFLLLSRLRALAPDGRSKSFAASADGYGRGEGCGVVVLKRLSRAQRDGDRILGVVRGTAINHDGPSTGLIAPNGNAQRAVIRQALAASNLAAGDIDYVEAHGTGTPLGDPVEIEALSAVYGEGRSTPLAVGSIKSNIGHLEWASGIAGVLKVLAAMKDQVIPASLHSRELNPAIDWSRVPVRVVRANETWSRGARARRAGVSSYGMSGTNAHVILEEPPVQAQAPLAQEGGPELFTLSAKSQAALGAVTQRFSTHLRAHPEWSLRELASSLATSRVHHAQRLAVVASSRDELHALLELPREDAPARRGKVGFVFTGQGAQVLGMGRELHRAWPVFKAAWDRCAAVFDRELGRPLAEVVWGSEASLLDQTLYTQPALFTFEYALAALWRSWGVEPDVVLGHSIGEFVAACVAEVFSVEDGARLVAARAKAMHALPPGGAMIAVSCAADVALEAIGDDPSVTLAAINAPEAIVLSGEEARVLAVAERLAARGLRTTRLRVSHAFHSPRMDPMLQAFERVAEGIPSRTAVLPIASNLTGRLAGSELSSASYWPRQLRGTVRFADGLRAAAEAGVTRFIEIGPRSALTPMVVSTLVDVSAIPSVRGDRPEAQAVLSALGEWYSQGGRVEWRGVFPAGGRRAELPGYPWERERHWIEQAPAGGALGRAGKWPLAGVQLSIPGDAWHHVAVVNRSTPGFVADHLVHGRVMIAGAFQIGTVLAVAAERWPGRALELSQVEFHRVLVLDHDREVELHVVLEPEGTDGGARRFVTQSLDEQGKWIIHARGLVRPTDAAPQTRGQPEAPVEVGPAQIHEKLAAMKIVWGARWQWISAARYGAKGSLATLTPTSASALEAGPLHPALLDNAFCVALLDAVFAPGDGTPKLPFAVERVRWWQAPAGAVRAVCVPQDAPLVADFALLAEDGSVVAEIEGLSCRAAPEDRLLAARGASGGAPEAGEGQEGYLELEWQSQPAPKPRAASRHWQLLGGGSFALELAQALEARGQRVSRGALAGSAPDHVVHLGSLDSAEGFGASGLEAALVSGYDDVVETVKRLAGLTVSPRLWLVTRGAQAAGGPIAVSQSPVVGLGRVIALEHAELRCARIDLDPARPRGEASVLAAELVGESPEDELALRGDRRLVARLVRRAPTPVVERLELAGDRPFRLETDEPGVLEHLRLRLDQPRRPGPGEVELAVEAAGLNFVSVLFALGLMPKDAKGIGTAPGGDVAGRVVAVGEGVTGLAVGQRVLALAKTAFQSRLTLPATLVLPVPGKLSMAEAASLPVAFLTAWYSLDRVAHLRRGERVLIHSGTGGIGHAAIQWAKHVGAEIYATAGSAKKRAYLESLGVTRVSDSRSNRFVADVRAWSGGEGVDVVLNSLSGDLIDASFDLLRSHGRFVELGKRDYYADRPLGLKPFLRNLSFTLVDLLAMMEERPAWVRELLIETLAHVESGVFSPPPVSTFAIGRSAEAFGVMARGEHIGKICVTLPDAEAKVSVAGEARVGIRADGSYLVTGGLGGLGLSVAGWLSERGAGSVVLVGRSGATTAAQHAAIAAIQARGTRVTVAQVDLSDRGRVAELIENVTRAGPPLRGVIHAAGLLDDALLTKQTPAKARAVMAPKVLGAIHLHELTRQCPLELFVLYSSGAGLLGSPGQANYAAANTFLDALAHHRRAQGLPALSIDWGAFAEVGMAAVHDNRAARLASQGMRSLSPAEGLQALEALLGSSSPQVGVIPLDSRRWLEAYPGAAKSKLLSSLIAAPATEAPRDSLHARLAAISAAEREPIVRDLVRAQVARVLRIAEAKIAPEASFLSIGMDSLTGLELRNRLTGELGISLPATLIFQHPTVGAVTGLVLDALVRAALASAPADETDLEEGTL